MTAWSSGDIVGPDGEDWRVPVSELAARQARLGVMLAEAGLPGALIQHPVDLYYYGGGRQDGSLFIPANGAGGSEEAGGNGPVAFVRRSLKRAQWEAGGDDAPIRSRPSLVCRRFRRRWPKWASARLQPCRLVKLLPRSSVVLPRLFPRWVKPAT